MDVAVEQCQDATVHHQPITVDQQIFDLNVFTLMIFAINVNQSYLIDAISSKLPQAIAEWDSAYVPEQPSNI